MQTLSCVIWLLSSISHYFAYVHKCNTCIREEIQNQWRNDVQGVTLINYRVIWILGLYLSRSNINFLSFFSHHNHGDNTVDDVNYKCTGLNFSTAKEHCNKTCNVRIKVLKLLVGVEFCKNCITQDLVEQQLTGYYQINVRCSQFKCLV